MEGPSRQNEWIEVVKDSMEFETYRVQNYKETKKMMGRRVWHQYKHYHA
jgi:hypothetical protein